MYRSQNQPVGVHKTVFFMRSVVYGCEENTYLRFRVDLEGHSTLGPFHEGLSFAEPTGAEVDSDPVLGQIMNDGTNHHARLSERRQVRRREGAMSAHVHVRVCMRVCQSKHETESQIRLNIGSLSVSFLKLESARAPGDRTLESMVLLPLGSRLLCRWSRFWLFWRERLSLWGRWPCA